MGRVREGNKKTLIPTFSRKREKGPARAVHTPLVAGPRTPFPPLPPFAGEGRVRVFSLSFPFSPTPIAAT
jgi:hypothetical protein